MRRVRSRALAGTILAILILAGTGIAVVRGAAAGPSRWLPGDTAITAAAGVQSAPYIARGADTLLAVWSDARAITPQGGYQYETAWDIYGIRLDSNGNPIEPTSFVITDATASQEFPKAAWNGANWLVVFETYALTGTGYYYEKRLAFVRVSPAGQVLDARPVPIHNTQPTGGSYWDVTSDGANWIVAFQGTSAGMDLIAVRISPDGVVLDPPTKVLVPATYYMRSNLKLACAAGTCLLTFDDYYGNGVNTTGAVRFDSNLNVLGGGLFTLNASPLAHLAANGSGFYIVWNGQLPDYSTAVLGSRVTTAGQKLEGTGVNISGTHPPDYTSTTWLHWDSANGVWKVTWGYQGVVAVARISTSGQVLDPGGRSVTVPLSGPAAGTATGGVQLVWPEYVSGENDVRTGHITSGFTAGPVLTVSTAQPQQLHADLATSGNGYLVAFRSEIGATNRVMAQPLDSAGNALLAEPVQLDAGPVLSGPGAPAVAWNGSLYLVTWGNSQGIVAQRLAADGTKIDPAPFVVMPQAFGRPAVAALGDTFLVVGRKYGYTPEFIDVFAARVRGSDGAVLDTAPKLIGGGFASAVAAAVLGDRWIVAWHSNWSHDDSGADTVINFVSADGTVATGIGVYNFSTAGGNGIFSIGLASSGSVALLVQSAEVTSGVETDMIGWLIQPDGALSGRINFTPWREDQYRPRVAWDGSQFIIAYQDQRNAFAAQSLEQLDASSDLFAMRVWADGTIVDPQGFLFSASPHSETHPNLAAANGATLLLGSFLRPETGIVAYRIGYNQYNSANQWPVALAAASPADGAVPLAVSFSSAGSYDPDGAISAYFWDFGDGSAATDANPGHTYSVPGEYVATLTITDNSGSQTTQTVRVNAPAPNQPPVAQASASPASGAAPLNVVFSAAGSYDPDGSIGNYKWVFHDGSEYWNATAYHTYDSPGTYVATLYVTDAANATGTATVTISVGVTQPTMTPTRTATPTATVIVAPTATRTPTRTPAPTATRRGQKTATRTATPTRTPTSPAGPTATAIPIATATATPTAASACTTNCLRSTAITLSASGFARVTVNGSVTVKSESGAAVAGATVYTTWTRPDGTQAGQSAATNSSGVAGFSTSGGRGTYSLTVTNITKGGSTFDSTNSVLSKSITR